MDASALAAGITRHPEFLRPPRDPRGQGAGASGSADGQSVLEFLFLLPVMVSLTLLLIRVNTAIQIGIVNEQWVREMVLYISGNGAIYPRRPAIMTDLANLGYNQIVLGMASDYVASSDGWGDGSNGAVDAPVYNIAGNKVLGSDAAQEEPSNRSRIRVRSTVTLCLPLITVGGSPVLGNNNGGIAYNLPDSPSSYANAFCESRLEYP